MEDINFHVDMILKDCDDLKNISDIEAQIQGCPRTFKDFGKCLLDGELKMTKGKEKKECYIFLFQQVMCICKSLNQQKYTLLEILDLKNYKMVDETKKLSWKLIHKNGAVDIQFQASNVALKQNWMVALSKAYNLLYPAELPNSTSHVFQMKTFDSTTWCTNCNRLLRGIFFQGYYCQQCNSSSHKECLYMRYNCTPYASRLRHTWQQRISKCLANCSYCGRRLNNLPHQEWVCSSCSTSVHVECAHFLEDCMGHLISTDPLPHQELLPAQMETPTDLLETYPWFAGEMNRESANSILASTEIGTFLLRYSINNGSTYFAISVKAIESTRHIMVRWVNSTPNTISIARETFENFEDLIKWCSAENLVKDFPKIGTALVKPWKCVFYTAIVTSKYDGHEKNSIALDKKKHVIILSKDKNSSGWWKVKFGDQVGYFPKNFLKVDSFCHEQKI